MQKKLKKIIAREFLIFLAALILLLVCYFVWFYYSDYCRNNIAAKYQAEYNSLVDYEILPYRLKVYYFINREIRNEDKMNNVQKFIANLKDESFALEKYDYVAEEIALPKSTKKEYLKKISDDHASEEYLEEIFQIEKKMKSLEENVMCNPHKSTYVLNILLISIVFLFYILRYLFYAVKWSIVQLKS